MKRWKSWMKAMIVSAVLCVLCAFTAMADDYYYLKTPDSVYWGDGEDGIAHWTKVEKAKKYEVVLYEGESRVKRVYTTGCRINLSEYFTNDGQYYFTVRAVPSDTQRRFVAGEWASSDELDVDWMGDTEGRWRKYSTGIKYQKADRTYYTDEWAKIKGEWYYFGSDSYMKTGWIQLAGTWFYLENDGKMSTGWEQINNVWYYFNNSGAMQTGWVQTKPGYWYYLNSDGAMLCNTVVEGHQLNADGLMIN